QTRLNQSRVRDDNLNTLLNLASNPVLSIFLLCRLRSQYSYLDTYALQNRLQAFVSFPVASEVNVHITTATTLQLGLDEPDQLLLLVAGRPLVKNSRLIDDAFLTGPMIAG